MRIRIARRSLERIKRRVRQETRRSRGRSMREILERLSPVITGWVNYFALADAKGHMVRLDEWLRRRLRQVLWKQWKIPRNRYRNLRALGVSKYWAIRVGGSSKGCWRMSASLPLQQALDNAFLHSLGLKSFLKQYQLRHT